MWNMRHPITAEFAGLDLAPFLAQTNALTLILRKAVLAAYTHPFLPPQRTTLSAQREVKNTDFHLYQEWSSEESPYLELLATRGAQEVFAVRVPQHVEPQLVGAAESLVTLCALINLFRMETADVFLDLELQMTE